MAPDSASNFCSAPVLYLFPWYFFLFRTLFVIATIHFIRKTRFSVDKLIVPLCDEHLVTKYGIASIV